MKFGCFLFVTMAFCGLVTNASYAQYHRSTAKAVTKAAPSSPGLRRGSAGGPANKPGGIGGLASTPGGINGTIRPKF